MKSHAGEWVPFTAEADTIVVNIGDMLQRLTNHVYPSTTHRVVNPPGESARKPRYSVPFFLHPNPDFVIDVLPSCVDAAHPSRYPHADHRARLPAGTAARDQADLRRRDFRGPVGRVCSIFKRAGIMRRAPAVLHLRIRTHAPATRARSHRHRGGRCDRLLAGICTVSGARRFHAARVRAARSARRGRCSSTTTIFRCRDRSFGRSASHRSGCRRRCSARTISRTRSRDSLLHVAVSVALVSRDPRRRDRASPGRTLHAGVCAAPGGARDRVLVVGAVRSAGDVVRVHRDPRGARSRRAAAHGPPCSSRCSAYSPRCCRRRRRSLPSLRSDWSGVAWRAATKRVHRADAMRAIAALGASRCCFCVWRTAVLGTVATGLAGDVSIDDAIGRGFVALDRELARIPDVRAATRSDGASCTGNCRREFDRLTPECHGLDANAMARVRAIPRSCCAAYVSSRCRRCFKRRSLR